MEYQYALRLTSEKRPPISKNTFTNFRKRVNDYYKEIGRLRKTMGEKEYIKECNQRAGVEGIPAVFRRKYNVDDMPSWD
jgi:hypothetical protein